MNRIGIFLDRDGTINEEVDFLRSPDDLRLIPGSADAIREANEMAWKVFVATNQSGIARGLLTEKQLEEIHTRLRAELRIYGAHLDSIYYCPHHPDFGSTQYGIECDCRKPKPGMLLRAARKYNIDLHTSFAIGDRLIDVQTGNNAGATSILVLTGYGKDELDLCRQQNVPIGFVAENLYAAIQFVKQAVLMEQSSTSTGGAHS